MDISKLNKTALNKDFVPSKKLSELELNKIYEINDIKKAKTTYGIRFFVIIENKFTVFLPQRVAKLLQEDESLYLETREACKNGGLAMQYSGGRYNLIEFVKKDI